MPSMHAPCTFLSPFRRLFVPPFMETDQNLCERTGKPSHIAQSAHSELFPEIWLVFFTLLGAFFMPSTNSGLPPAWHKRYLNVADTAIDEGIRAVDRGVTHSVPDSGSSGSSGSRSSHYDPSRSQYEEAKSRAVGHWINDGWSWAAWWMLMVGLHKLQLCQGQSLRYCSWSRLEMCQDSTLIIRCGSNRRIRFGHWCYMVRFFLILHFLDIGVYWVYIWCCFKILPALQQSATCKRIQFSEHNRSSFSGSSADDLVSWHLRFIMVNGQQWSWLVTVHGDAHDWSW